MRKTIYVKSQEQWDRIKLIAEQGGISVSELILSQFEGSGVKLGKETQLDRIESKLDELIGNKGGFDDEANPGRELHREKMAEEAAHKVYIENLSKAQNAQDDIEMLAAKQVELDAQRKGRDPKREKIAKVRDRVIGYSKERQLGRGGKK